MKPGDLVFMQYDDDYNSRFKAGDTGMITAHSAVQPNKRDGDGMFDVLVHGKIEYLFHYETVLVSDQLQLVNDGTDCYDREKEGA